MDSNVLKLKCLFNCIQSQGLIDHHGWALGYPSIDDNEKVDECFVNWSSLDETMAYNDIVTPLVVVAYEIDNWTLGNYGYLV